MISLGCMLDVVFMLQVKRRDRGLVWSPTGVVLPDPVDPGPDTEELSGNSLTGLHNTEKIII